MEVCIYLKRSLELRVWEVSDYSVLCECPGIEENTRKLVATQGPKSLEDLRTITLPRIQVIARCPIKEAQSLQEFAQNLCANALATSLTVGADDLIIGLRPYFEPSNSNLSPKRDLAYDLIASDRSNGNLVLTKCLKCGGGLQEIRVPLNGLKASNIQVKLIAPHTVLDTDLTFSTTASINPVEGSVKAANIRVPSEIEVGSLALPKPLLQSSRAKAVSKNKIMDKTNRDGKQMENFGVYSSDAPRYEDKPRSQPPQKSIPAFSQYSTFQSPDSALQLMRRKAEEAALSTVTVKRLKSSANVSYFVDHEVQDPLQQALSPPPNAAKFFRSAQKPSAPFFFTDAQQLKSEIACPSIEDLVPIKTSTQQTPLYATQLYSQEISEPQQFRQRLPRRDVHSDSYAAEDDVNVAKENLPFPDIRREREERFKKAFAF